ncbi:MAG: hypothetical protein IID54_05035, partial [Proteobacteria bacterium]|nr:hypothetical protein [Pseudomonadota bacterium]
PPRGDSYTPGTFNPPYYGGGHYGGGGYGGGGYGYGGWGNGGGTVAGNYLTGLGRAIRAQGQYNLDTSAATINLEEARTRQIDNRKLWTNTYFEMRKVNQASRDAERRPRGTPETRVRLAQEAAPNRFSPGELDPVTGVVIDYELPVMKPEAPRGLLGLHPDRDENLWLAMMYQGGLMRFNTETKEITTFPLPIEWQNGSTQQSMVSPRNWHVDGKVWTNDQSDHTFMRLDVATGTYEKLPFLLDQHGEPINGYEIPSDQDNNLWALEFGGRGTRIGMVDAKTHELTTWRSPFPRASPRRGQFDEDGILWFAEFGANAIGRFDPETQQMREWVLPTKWIMPYDAVKDDRGEIWTGSMGSDRVVRLNPETGEFVEYLLPAYTNIRRVFFDDATRSFWTGANHTNHIVRLEPLD